MKAHKVEETDKESQTEKACSKIELKKKEETQTAADQTKTIEGIKRGTVKQHERRTHIDSRRTPNENHRDKEQ